MTQLAGMVRTTPRLSSAITPLTGQNPTRIRCIPLSSSHISARCVCVFVCVHVCVTFTGSQRELSGQTAAGALGGSLFPASHASLSNGERARRSVNQSPVLFHLTHAECPMVRYFPPRFSGGAVKQRHLSDTCCRDNAHGGRVVAAATYFLFYTTRKMFLYRIGILNIFS